MNELLELKLQKEKKPRKKFDRTVYIALTDAMAWTLCGFCKYCSGGCDDNQCTHPLDNQQDFMEDIEPGFDCWAFKPRKNFTVSDFADIAGTYMEQGWEVCSFDKSKDGKIVMIGAKEWFI